MTPPARIYRVQWAGRIVWRVPIGEEVSRPLVAVVDGETTMLRLKGHGKAAQGKPPQAGCLLFLYIYMHIER